MKQLRIESLVIRDQMEDALTPVAFTITMCILVYPFVGVTSLFITLLAPTTFIIWIFVLNLYQGMVLYAFARLIIMYLGSYKSALIALSAETTKATKFYASPPFCCVKGCIEEKKNE